MMKEEDIPAHNAVPRWVIFSVKVTAASIEGKREEGGEGRGDVRQWDMGTARERKQGNH